MGVCRFSPGVPWEWRDSVLSAPEVPCGLMGVSPFGHQMPLGVEGHASTCVGGLTSGTSISSSPVLLKAVTVVGITTTIYCCCCCQQAADGHYLISDMMQILSSFSDVLGGQKKITSRTKSYLVLAHARTCIIFQCFFSYVVFKTYTYELGQPRR